MFIQNSKPFVAVQGSDKADPIINLTKCLYILPPEACDEYSNPRSWVDRDLWKMEFKFENNTNGFWLFETEADAMEEFDRVTEQALQL